MSASRRRRAGAPSDTWCESFGRIDRRRQLVPDFDLVAVGVAEEDVRLARNELAVIPDLAARFANRGEGALEVGRSGQPKPEMRDAADPAGLTRLALEHDHVTAARSLRLDEIVLLVDGHHPKDGFIEAERSSRIANGESDVRQAERLDRSGALACGCHDVATTKKKAHASYFFVLLFVTVAGGFVGVGAVSVTLYFASEELSAAAFTKSALASLIAFGISTFASL